MATELEPTRTTRPEDDVHAAVRARYAEAALAVAESPTAAEAAARSGAPHDCRGEGGARPRPGPGGRRRYRRPALGPPGWPDRPGDRRRHDRRDARAGPAERGRGGGPPQPGPGGGGRGPRPR